MKTHLELTQSQRELFRNQGCLLLEGAVSLNEARRARTHILSELKRLNIWASGKSLSRKFKDLPVFQQIGRVSGQIDLTGARAQLMPQNVVEVMSALAESRVSASQSPQLLLSLPNQGEWTMDSLNWHVDISLPESDIVPGVQAFVLIDDVLPNGGATLALGGSHRLAAKGSNREEIQRALAQGKVLQKTRSVVMMSGATLPIIEMSGSAGDVYLMDLRVLHTPSVNATRHLRMMATARYFR